MISLVSGQTGQQEATYKDLHLPEATEATYKDLHLPVIYNLLQLELERVGLAQTGLLVTKSWPPARAWVFPLQDSHYRAVESPFFMVPI
jgi:hypothetical protein